MCSSALQFDIHMCYVEDSLDVPINLIMYCDFGVTVELNFHELLFGCRYPSDNRKHVAYRVG
jgi:hypothetical protein